MVMESPFFMSWLMKRFATLGGSMEHKKVTKLSDLLEHPFSPRLIVNCSGLGSQKKKNSISPSSLHSVWMIGAHKLVGDEQVHPVRGQVVKVHAPWVHHFYSALSEGEELVYILPRSDCVVLGGTAQVSISYPLS